MEILLPAIPDKRYFTIGEVSELCGVKPHVLRYWEQEFAQLRPVKRRGNRRYYQHHEVLLIRRIRDLLYEQGFTISGARNRLAELGPAAARALDDGDPTGEDLSTPHLILGGGRVEAMLAPSPVPPTGSTPAPIRSPLAPGRGAFVDVPTPQVARDALVRSGARSLREELLLIRALLDPESPDVPDIVLG
ncbi:MerR family transcriptional regulator [Sphaerotilus sp.]|uniref:MerR family transcriptional regulator n=1 Tax=Sphaerotilus sp. TaxID=2093942 RepID=UPI0034E2A60B